MLSFYYGNEFKQTDTRTDGAMKIYHDQNLLNEKIDGLITAFNKKWMHVAYISCEVPLEANEYPLKVKLNRVSGKKRSISSRS